MKAILLLLVASSCQLSGPKDQSEPADPAARPGPPQASPALSTPVRSQLAVGYRWRQHKAEASTEQSTQGVTGNAVFTLSAREDTLVLNRSAMRGKQLWEVTAHEGFVVAGALQVHKDWVAVAAHSMISSGATLVIFNPETGKETHRVQIHGLGEVSHSKYRNQVQLSILDGKLVVFGKESAGHYVEVYSPGDWERVSNHKVAEELATLPWQWAGPDRVSFRGGPDTVKHESGSYHYQPSDHPAQAQLRKNNTQGQELWKSSLRGLGDCGTASMLEHDTRLYLVDYCSISTGAQLSIYQAGSGKLLAQRSLDGLEGVAHSEYWNEVEIKALPGRVVIFGREAAGRYIEIVDSEGRLQSLQTFRNH